MSDTPLLIAGLGNPGEKYARHRHNVGFMALDAIAARYRFSDWRSRYSGLVAEGTLDGRKTVLLKPMTYMNESGAAVGAAARYMKLDNAAVAVIHDELDLAPAKLRAKAGGGDAGHNGLRSITATLGPDYRRVRIGIGHPGAPELVHPYVLHDFSKADREWLNPLLDAIAEAAPYLARDDDAGFMNKVSVILKPPVKKPMPDDKDKKKKDGHGI
jgi:peptidyl-tRNA hydrolase, PTH1 family